MNEYNLTPEMETEQRQGVLDWCEKNELVIRIVVSALTALAVCLMCR